MLLKAMNSICINLVITINIEKKSKHWKHDSSDTISDINSKQEKVSDSVRFSVSIIRFPLDITRPENSPSECVQVLSELLEYETVSRSGDRSSSVVSSFTDIF